MSTSAIIMMLVALIVIWGGFIVSVLQTAFPVKNGKTA